MKPLLIGLCLAVLSVAAFSDATFNQAQAQARWALNYIGTTKNSAQRARYIQDINRYGGILQAYLGQKPTPFAGDPHLFIEQLEKLAAAKQDQIRRLAELEQRQRLGYGGGNDDSDFAEQQQEQRMRRLENEVQAQRIRARELAEQQAAAARREAYKRGVMGR